MIHTLHATVHTCVEYEMKRNVSFSIGGHGLLRTMSISKAKHGSWYSEGYFSKSRSRGKYI
jgi:hypothetical protein